MKEVVVFTFLVLRLVLVHILGPRKDKVRCPVLVFRRGISNAICDLVLYLLYGGLKVSLIYDGAIPLQYLKTVVVM